jgi:hypothetical protein
MKVKIKKKKTYPYLHTHIYIYIYIYKKCVHIPGQEEPKRNASVEDTHLHTTATLKQNIRKPPTYV